MPLPAGHVLARSYDRFGRPTGIALGADYQVAYAYDDVGRFAAITSAVNAVTTAVKYAYLAQSDLLSGWTVGVAPGVSNLIVRRSYEPRRDLVATVQVANATGTLARFVYANDPLGRRVSRNDAWADGATVSNVFGYDVRSELEAAVMGTNQFGYQYDAIGNRQVAVANDQTVQYEANALNQYASILPAAGIPAYDADGNMTSDGTFIYSWDAENRLTEVRPAATNAGAALTQSLYDYQGRRVGKRVFAWGTFRDIDDWYWTESRYFTYDGWNPIDERKPVRPTTMVPYIPTTSISLLGLGGQTAASSIWGLDLSGSLQGAGGVGGLLCHVRGDCPLFSFCDANGNVTGLVDTNGVAVAQYDYDPFGNLLAQSGDQAAANPFRFSSKPWDEETGLYYYGYRFYSPQLGRWINRDPMGEAAGGLAYGFVDNDSVNGFDALGLWNELVHKKWTILWARGEGYSSVSSERIGNECNDVDKGTTSPLPIFGDQSYHFNTSAGGVDDSRLIHEREHLQKAKDACDKNKNTDNPEKAVRNLGLALHPRQDWYAHGDYPGGFRIHNKNGSRVPGLSRNYTHAPSDYPDTLWLDANSTDSDKRPTGEDVQRNNEVTYSIGYKRFNATATASKADLKTYLDHIRQNAVDCGKCRDCFLNGNCSW